MTKHTTEFVPAYVVPMLKTRGFKQIPLYASYMAGIASPHYNLAHVIAAYGLDFTHWLVDEIAAGRIDIREVTARWLAHRTLENESFDPAKYAGAVTDYAYENIHATPTQPQPDAVFAAAS